MLEIPGSKSATTDRPFGGGSGPQPVATRAVGTLAAGLAHDLNNMLAAILSTAELVALRHEDDGDTTRDLGSIIGQASRASRLIRQILAFSRQEVLRPVSSDLAILLQDLEPTLRALIGPDMRLDLRMAMVPPVHIDPGAIERVLVNLVLNARDAAPGGRVVVELRDSAAPAMGASFMPEGHYALLSVSDNGPGIPPELQSRVFEPYFTTRANGQGLGLSTAYGIVKQSGGYLLLDRGLMGGARFTIYLPLLGDRPVPVRSGHCRGGAILLAEDEPLLRQSVARGLRSWGYSVVEAVDGEDALELFQPDKVGLLLSDIRMPRMDGIALTRELHARSPDTPVLLMSGYADEEARNAVGKLGVQFIPKPFTMAVLTECIGEMI